MYQLEVSEDAKKQLRLIEKSGKKIEIKKIETIFKEIVVTPFTGTGKPEALKHDLSGYWSRRLNKKDRIIYKVEEDKVIVFVVSVLGHYFDED